MRLPEVEGVLWRIFLMVFYPGWKAESAMIIDAAHCPETLC